MRHLGLVVENRASRHADNLAYLGFMISPSSDERMIAIREAVEQLGRVEQCLSLGVFE